MDRFEIAQGKEPPMPPASSEYRGIKGYDSLLRKDDPSKPSLSIFPDTLGNQILEVRIPAVMIRQVLPRGVIPQSDAEEDERRDRALDLLSARLLEVIHNAVLSVVTGRVNEHGYADAEHSMNALQDFWFSQDPTNDPRNRSNLQVPAQQMQNLFANTWPEPSAPADDDP